MDIDELVASLKQRKLEIDCVDMTLTQSTNVKPIIYKGKGYIRQTEDDSLTFKLFVFETTNIDGIACFESSLISHAGKLFEAGEFYTLTAKTIEGMEWIAHQILPKCTWPLLDKNPIVSGGISFLSCLTQPPVESYALRLYIFDDAEIPYRLWNETKTDGKSSLTRTKDEFTVAGLNFVVRKNNFGFSIEASSHEPLNETFHTRIEESLRFVLAKSVQWRVMIHNNGNTQHIEVDSAVPMAQTTRMHPPIAPQDIEYYEFFWALFSCYLEYVIKNTPHPYWNDISYHLHNAREASANSVHAWAIALGVAVEGACDLIKIEQKQDEQRNLGALRDNILEHVSQDPQFSAYMKRLEGLLGMMMNVRVKDRLEWLATTGNVDKNYIKAWGKLRNTQAHPTQTDLRDISTDNYQILFDLINQSTTLLYQVTFYLIGYKGKFTDYGIRGYPERDYPTVFDANMGHAPS